MILQIFLMLVGFILLVKGADFLVDGASNIAKKFHIPEIVIGLTIVSIGTSMPELMVSLTSAIGGHSDISIGNVIGSNLANLLLILGLCAVINNLRFKKETKFLESPFALLITILLFVFANNTILGPNMCISRTEGFILVGLCAVFIVYNIVMARRGDSFDGINKELVIVNIEMKSPRYLIKSITYVVVGIIGLKYGGDLVVNSCTEIARILGMSEKIISLTIIAIATSLPELVTSIIATKKGEVDLAIGNVIGSCIFNILLIIGVSAIIAPIGYSASYNKDLAILIVATLFLVLFPFIGKKDEMTKANGGIYVLGYVAYMAFLVISNM